MLVPFVSSHVVGVLLGQQAAVFIEPLMWPAVVRTPTAGVLMDSLRHGIVNGPRHSWAEQQYQGCHDFSSGSANRGIESGSSHDASRSPLEGR